MSFAERSTAPPQIKIPACGVREIIEALNDDEAAALRAMLAEPLKVRTTSSLVADFAGEGYPLSDATIGKHRRLDCSCKRLANS